MAYVVILINLLYYSCRDLIVFVRHSLNFQYQLSVNVKTTPMQQIILQKYTM